MEKLAAYFNKYKFAVLILLVGILLMLVPGKKTSVPQETSVETQEVYSLEKTETEMEELLRHISGVGQIKVMLSLKSGSSLQLAQDSTQSERDTERKKEEQIVKLNRGSGCQDVVITEQTYPVYQGAVVVCQGAENAKVRLSVIEAVAVLTGLSSEKISVVKWES